MNRGIAHPSHLPVRVRTQTGRSQPQRDLPWTAPEPFALITETTTDGDRITAAKTKQLADRQAADHSQLCIPHSQLPHATPDPR